MRDERQGLRMERRWWRIYHNRGGPRCGSGLRG
eukprot:CCRYP_010535-RE/>CCRYP_010535-RE protein AED:0.48 eAED:0.48 QI:0/-1/0/1/-1/0/1/0/32